MTEALGTVAGALNPAEGSFLDDNLLVEHFRVVAEGSLDRLALAFLLR